MDPMEMVGMFLVGAALGSLITTGLISRSLKRIYRRNELILEEGYRELARLRATNNVQEAFLDTQDASKVN